MTEYNRNQAHSHKIEAENIDKNVGSAQSQLNSLDGVHLPKVLVNGVTKTSQLENIVVQTVRKGNSASNSNKTLLGADTALTVIFVVLLLVGFLMIKSEPMDSQTPEDVKKKMLEKAKKMKEKHPELYKDAFNDLEKPTRTIAEENYIRLAFKVWGFVCLGCACVVALLKWWF